MPNSHVAIFVESYHRVLNAEGSQTSVELVKTNK